MVSVADATTPLAREDGETVSHHGTRGLLSAQMFPAGGYRTELARCYQDRYGSTACIRSIQISEQSLSFLAQHCILREFYLNQGGPTDVHQTASWQFFHITVPLAQRIQSIPKTCGTHPITTFLPSLVYV